MTVGSIKLAHLVWKDDHLTVASARSKNDQCGEFSFPRSVYANPKEPAICPILSLAVYILSRPFRNEGVHPALFDGPDQSDRYSKILGDVLSQLPDSLASHLGAQRGDIGTHSARKGAPTFALSIPGGPSPVSIFLRAGWSLGNLKDRYIFAGEGGDQLCGRAVCGLSLMDSRFGVLPPHFPDDTLTAVTDQDWKRILPGYRLCPECFRQVRQGRFIHFQTPTYIVHSPSVYRTSSPRSSIMRNFSVTTFRRSTHFFLVNCLLEDTSRNFE